MEVFRHGKYKSAVEPFLENTMSDANREQITSYLRSLWNSYAEAVSSSRGLSLSELIEWPIVCGGALLNWRSSTT